MRFYKKKMLIRNEKRSEESSLRELSEVYAVSNRDGRVEIFRLFTFCNKQPNSKFTSGLYLITDILEKEKELEKDCYITRHQVMNEPYFLGLLSAGCYVEIKADEIKDIKTTDDYDKYIDKCMKSFTPEFIKKELSFDKFKGVLDVKIFNEHRLTRINSVKKEYNNNNNDYNLSGCAIKDRSPRFDYVLTHQNALTMEVIDRNVVIKYTNAIYDSFLLIEELTGISCGVHTISNIDMIQMTLKSALRTTNLSASDVEKYRVKIGQKIVDIVLSQSTVNTFVISTTKSSWKDLKSIFSKDKYNIKTLSSHNPNSGNNIKTSVLSLK